MQTYGMMSPYTAYQTRFSASQSIEKRFLGQQRSEGFQRQASVPKFGLSEESITYTGWQEKEVRQYMKEFGELEQPPYNAKFHAGRREAFLDKLPPNTTVIIPGNTLHLRNGDVDYDFRQDSNFWYLTGFNEPDAIAILSNDPEQPEFALLVPPMDPEATIWTGKRAGVEGAQNIYQANEAYSLDDKSTVLEHVATESRKLMMIPSQVNESLNEEIRVHVISSRLDSRMGNPVSYLYKLRAVKTPYEIALMQRAVDISIKGHRRAMEKLKLTPGLMKKYPDHLGKGLNEGTIQAALEEPFKQNGGVRTAYPSIVASGANACVLHYFQNNDNAQPKDSVLIDAGSECGNYAGDITRVWPVGGKFSPAQKALYQVVLGAQKAAIEAVKPGVTMGEIDAVAREKMAEGLIRLGILTGTVEEALGTDVLTAPLRKYFPHSTGHMLGLDVHDVGIGETGKGVPSSSNGKRDYLDTPIEEGWTFTIEPGIYITQKMVEEEGLDPKWANIGIRIEDDILMTPDGAKNLSEALPREIKDIEALMKGKSRLAQTLDLNG